MSIAKIRGDLGLAAPNPYSRGMVLLCPMLHDTVASRICAILDLNYCNNFTRSHTLRGNGIGRRASRGMQSVEQIIPRRAWNDLE